MVVNLYCTGQSNSRDVTDHCSQWTCLWRTLHWLMCRCLNHSRSIMRVVGFVSHSTEQWCFKLHINIKANTRSSFTRTIIVCNPPQHSLPGAFAPGPHCEVMVTLIFMTLPLILGIDSWAAEFGHGRRRRQIFRISRKTAENNFGDADDSIVATPPNSTFGDLSTNCVLSNYCDYISCLNHVLPLCQVLLLLQKNMAEWKYVT